MGIYKPDNIKKILLYGQSNMTPIIASGLLPVKYQDAQFNSWKWTGSALVRIWHNGVDNWGIQELLTLELAYKLNEPVVSVLVASGGKSLGINSGGLDFNVSSTGELHQQILDETSECTTALTNLGYQSEWYGAYRMQGETDMGVQVYAEAYQTDLQAETDSIKNNVSDMPVIIARTYSDPSRPYDDLVRSAQENVGSQSNNRWIDTDSFERTDDVHLSDVGMQQLMNSFL